MFTVPSDFSKASPRQHVTPLPPTNTRTHTGLVSQTVQLDGTLVFILSWEGVGFFALTPKSELVQSG